MLPRIDWRATALRKELLLSRLADDLRNICLTLENDVVVELLNRALLRAEQFPVTKREKENVQQRHT